MRIQVYPREIIKTRTCDFGILYEDISYAADGGLYAEMVQNRSFEYDATDNPLFTPLTGWECIARGDSVAQIHVESAFPLNGKNRHYLSLCVCTAGEGGGFCSTGYDGGMVVRAGEEYLFSCWVRLNAHLTPRVEGAFPAVRVALEDASGAPLGEARTFTPEEGGWRYIEFSLHALRGCDVGRLTITCFQPAVLDFDMVSLFPKNTFRGRRNGLRRDLAEKIAALQPRFVRFPGGCVVHSGSLDAHSRDSLYRWKNTIGPLEERPVRRNRWDYSQSNGLGFYELFQFCEDIGAQPLPVLSAGYDPHTLCAAPLDQMDEWIADALDLIEFANGSANTCWGAKRAQMGHAAPFHLRYLCIGNEEVGPAFTERYRLIAQAVREKHPEIHLIGSAELGARERSFALARETGTALLDEHFYACQEWMLSNYDRYDGQPEDIGILISEYSARGDQLENALAEAVMMMGMEKAPCVRMASYAPLLCHAEHVNWRPNLIWFDKSRVYGSASYSVQQLFSLYQGNCVLRAQDDEPAAESIRPRLSGKIGLSVREAQVRFRNIVLRNLHTGETRTAADAGLSTQNPCAELFDTDWTDYALECDFTKPERSLPAALAGCEGFRLEFARRESEDRLYWNLDGWQQLTSLNGIINGHECELSLAECPIRAGESGHMLLEVRENRVRASVNGRICHDYALHPKPPRPLYYSAVAREGEVIVKMVNVGAEPVSAQVELHGATCKSAVALRLSCNAPEACNSFDEPERISIIEESVPHCADGTQLVCPPHSFQVLRLACESADV